MHRLDVAASVSEWRLGHSLTLAATWTGRAATRLRSRVRAVRTPRLHHLAMLNQIENGSVFAALFGRRLTQARRIQRQITLRPDLAEARVKRRKFRAAL